MENEEKYIEERRKKAEDLTKLFIENQRFPIDKWKIVFSTFEGDGGFCCNPRYIAEALHKCDERFEMIWLVKEVNKHFPSYIKAVEYTDENIAYHLSTAHIWIDNYRKPYGTIKREGQLYIQTWHASIGFKAIGLDRGELFPKIARIVSEWDSNMVDYVISNSDYCDNSYPTALLYSGPTIRSGSPRVDCLINDREELRSQIRKRYNISQETRILLYAPTFRGGNQRGKKEVVADNSTIDIVNALSELKENTNSPWVAFLKLHPQLAAKMAQMPGMPTSEECIDVSMADDINELIAASDMLITDYSSCAFDAAFAKIPVLLYADDIEDYIMNRGKLMWEKEDLPFDIAENNEELIDNIQKFSDDDYKRRVDEFMEKHGIVEDGKAGQRIAHIILEKI